ncbi:hypothetical protein CWI37_1663p0020 [Hamiltosporidium tvaerminnensis]|uniref:Uncharacterized protein n=1 Tax=Hamiltosporidium tvaerminnensis TaxID=1176355 RepID=A0A4Q9KVP4_9MICR|nr:hypothetical protein CWI37_1663p0020 [Hamiltosporidium tvaerminnensis]
MLNILNHVYIKNTNPSVFMNNNQPFVNIFDTIEEVKDETFSKRTNINNISEEIPLEEISYKIDGWFDDSIHGLQFNPNTQFTR